MSAEVLRTCRELRVAETPDGGREVAEGEPKPLGEFRSAPAYVLLGDPGAGKTTEFKREQQALGDDAALVVSARDFRTFDVDSFPEWRDKTLFIDGLDETRAGAADSRTPLDAIRAKLVRLGRPRFRLSCREADWLGSNDHQHLRAASPDSEITVLRLDPLDNYSTAELLRSRHQVGDVEDFVGKAHLNGVGALLGNPLTLDLLARVVRQGGEWPRSRQETMEKACRHLAGEHNDDHRVGGGAVPRETVMDAAGYVGVLMLLAGKDGCAPTAGIEGTAIISIEDLSEPPGGLSRRALEDALSTKLFTAAGMTAVEMAFTPLHRQVAEFLAGRYLARRIDEGLPATRVVALMTGPGDGRVVTALRGLSAWLAAHSGEARRYLIPADPVGVGLYGDIGLFDLDERRLLLEALPGALVLDEAHRGDTAWAFRSLASVDMVPAIREILHRLRGDTGGDLSAGLGARRAPRVIDRARERNGDGRLAALVFGLLRHAETPSAETPSGVTELVPDLMAVVRDDAASASLRRRALRAYLHIASDRDDREETLTGLLDAIHSGSVSDPDGDLRGLLLIELYPVAVAPSEVWRHIVSRKRDNYFGRLRAFTNEILMERSEQRHLAEMLDALHEHAAQLVPALIESGADDLPLRLLEAALREQGESLEPQRLLGWLMAARLASMRGSIEKSAAGVRAWLEERPEIWKDVYLASLRQPVGDDHTGSRPFRYVDTLLWSRPPADVGQWCLDQALAMEASEPAVSQQLLIRAYDSLRYPSTSKGLTVEILRQRTRNTALEHPLDELLRPSCGPASPDMFDREIEEHRQRMDEQRRQQREDWAKALRDQQVELRENRLSPPKLCSLAMTYLGMFEDDEEDASPSNRVSDFIGGDQQLVAAVLAALRGAVLRDDVPSVDETISLHRLSKQSWMASPALAGLHLLDSEDPARLDGLGDERKREALAIYYCVAERYSYWQLWHGRLAPRDPLEAPDWEHRPMSVDAEGNFGAPDPMEALDWEHRPCEPHWYGRWLQQDPHLVLDVLCRCALAGVRAGEPRSAGMDDLDAIAGHEDLVHDVRLKLLKAFPTRSSNKQLPLLDSLLTNALDHPHKAELLALARQKQQLKSVPDAQRIRWWATDVLISQRSRLQQLRADLVKSETRVGHLAQFLRSVWDRFGGRRSILTAVTDPALLKEMVEILGSWCDAPLYLSGHVTLRMDTSELIARLIAQLGAVASDEARQALECLVDDPQLAGWRDDLVGAQERQRVIHRDASYRHPGVEEVQATLNDQAPANAADLAALVSGRLRDLCEDIRGGNSNIWRQFWNEDSHGRPTDPKPENSCRDALLTVLRERLPAGVGLDPEARYASGWQADLRATCKDFNVPIEIKRNSHHDLWTAMRTQLIGQYATDPATSGYGIYLVLWFGDGLTHRPSDGNRPGSAQELERRLKQHLTEDEARKISTIVLDVTKPAPLLLS